jgi:prevent-host-death family protein
MRQPPMEVTIHEAKTHLSRLMRRVEAGEEIIVRRGAKKIGRITPVLPQKENKNRCLGIWKEMFPDQSIDIPKSFFEPLTKDDLKEWNGTSTELKSLLPKKKQPNIKHKQPRKRSE